MRAAGSLVWIVFALSGLLVLGVMLFAPRVSQPADYHHFADQRAFFGIPNTFDVLSNVPFAIFGSMGLLALRRRGIQLDREEGHAYTVLFAGVLLTSAGSVFYHLAPTNARLVWDRLPMTLAFMGLLTAIIAERVSPRAADATLLPLLCMGAGSVGYWYLTEINGVGDLRPYLLVQFTPLLAIPAMIAFLPPKYTGTSLLFAVLGLYVLAKVLELLDGAVYSLGGVVSGHTLKHLVSATGVYLLLVMLIRRRPLIRTSSAPPSTPPRRRRVPIEQATDEGAGQVARSGS